MSCCYYCYCDFCLPHVEGRAADVYSAKRSEPNLDLNRILIKSVTVWYFPSASHTHTRARARITKNRVVTTIVCKEMALQLLKIFILSA